MPNPAAEHSDEPERFCLSEIRNQLRARPNLSPGYPWRYADGEPEVEFRVNDKCQTASGGSYIAKYIAYVELDHGTGIASIEVVNTLPEHVSPELLRLTIEHIRRGAESVLTTSGLDARLKLHDLVIHDVDCKPYRFEKPTAEGLARVIADAA